MLCAVVLHRARCRDTGLQPAWGTERLRGRMHGQYNAVNAVWLLPCGQRMARRAVPGVHKHWSRQVRAPPLFLMAARCARVKRRVHDGTASG